MKYVKEVNALRAEKLKEYQIKVLADLEDARINENEIFVTRIAELEKEIKRVEALTLIPISKERGNPYDDRS